MKLVAASSSRVCTYDGKEVDEMGGRAGDCCGFCETGGFGWRLAS